MTALRRPLTPIMRNMVQKNNYPGIKKKLRKAGLLLFLLYMGILLYFLFFADWYNHAPGSHTGYSYNLIPFREIMRFIKARNKLGFRSVFLNLGGNIIGFLPFGFFLPVITRKLRRAWLVIPLGFLTSATVECIQLVTRTGTFDVDDMSLNTAGAALGYLIFIICDAVRRKKYGR